MVQIRLMPLCPDGVVAIEDGASGIVGIGPVVGGVDEGLGEDHDRARRATVFVHDVTHAVFPRRPADARAVWIRAAVVEVCLV